MTNKTSNLDSRGNYIKSSDNHGVAPKETSAIVGPTGGGITVTITGWQDISTRAKSPREFLAAYHVNGEWFVDRVRMFPSGKFYISSTMEELKHPISKWMKLSEVMKDLS